MCGSKPKAPDPMQTALAQNVVNKDAIETAAKFNQINQNNPFGSVSYTGTLGGPDRTQNVTLTPELQKILQGQTGVTQGLTDLANTRLQGAPQDNFTLANQPFVRRAEGPGQYQTSFAAGPLKFGIDNAGPIQYQVDAGPEAQRSIADAGQVQRGVDLSGAPVLNSDFSQLSQQAQDAAYRQNQRYLDPQFSQQEDRLRSRLAAQGITEGSPAFQQEMENFGRTRQQAYEGARDEAIGQGFDLEAQMFGQNLAARQQGVGEQFNLGDFSNSALAQQFGMNQAQQQAYNQGIESDFARRLAAGNFYNQAQNQGFGQNAANAQFYNNAAGQEYGQNMGAAQFANDAMAKQFQDGLGLQQADQSWRNQSIGEDITRRNQNINEAMAYVNGAPVSPNMPQFTPFAQSAAAQASPDMVGLAGSNYQAAMQARGGLLGSAFGSLGQLGSAGIAACWVAREVYGIQNPKWLKFRAWMLRDSPAAFARWYLRNGERVAAWLRDKPIMKRLVRMSMDGVLYAQA